MKNEKRKFVIHYHTRLGHAPHWDLMLEKDKDLETFQLQISPDKLAKAISPVKLTKIFDHSPRFLTYQGPVNKGEGNIVMVEKGQYQISEIEPCHYEILFQGQKILGKFILEQIDCDLWLLSRLQK